MNQILAALLLFTAMTANATTTDDSTDFSVDNYLISINNGSVSTASTAKSTTTTTTTTTTKKTTTSNTYDRHNSR